MRTSDRLSLDCVLALPTKGWELLEPSKRMLKEVGGRYTSKPGRGQVGCYTAIKEKKRQRRQRTIMGEKMGEKNLMVRPIYFQHCFLKSQLVFLTLFSISIALPFVLFLKHILFRLAIALIPSTFYTETIQ